MEMRPLDLKLCLVCASTNLCSECKLRVGCPIRHTFYDGDLSVEVAVQMTELLIQKNIGEQKAYEHTSWLRHKILCERGAHPGGFSYM